MTKIHHHAAQHERRLKLAPPVVEVMKIGAGNEGLRCSAILYRRSRSASSPILLVLIRRRSRTIFRGRRRRLAILRGALSHRVEVLPSPTVYTPDSRGLRRSGIECRVRNQALRRGKIRGAGGLLRLS